MPASPSSMTSSAPNWRVSSSMSVSIGLSVSLVTLGLWSLHLHRRLALLARLLVSARDAARDDDGHSGDDVSLGGEDTNHQKFVSHLRLMSGHLLRYGPCEEHTMFISVSPGGEQNHNAQLVPQHCAIWIGGLTDGILGAPYLQHLSRQLHRNNCALVQINMRSSYRQYGLHTLRDDAEDIYRAMKKLLVLGAEKFFLIGHSTGCQDLCKLGDALVHLRGSGTETEKVAATDMMARWSGAVLQAPVSDREDLSAESLSALSYAEKSDDDDEIIPVRILGVGHPPMTCRRAKALWSRNGDDDYFSTDLTDDELARRLSGIGEATCAHFLLSGGDEYAGGPLKDGGDGAHASHGARLARLCGKDASSSVVSGALHSCSNRVEACVESILQHMRVVGFVASP